MAVKLSKLRPSYLFKLNTESLILNSTNIEILTAYEREVQVSGVQYSIVSEDNTYPSSINQVSGLQLSVMSKDIDNHSIIDYICINAVISSSQSIIASIDSMYIVAVCKPIPVGTIYVLKGKVKYNTGIPLPNRLVRIHNRSTGAVMAQGYSDSNGDYEFVFSSRELCYGVALDDDLNIDEEAIIHDRLIPYTQG
jgi:hypothetical protein